MLRSAMLAVNSAIAAPDPAATAAVAADVDEDDDDDEDDDEEEEDEDENLNADAAAADEKHVGEAVEVEGGDLVCRTPRRPPRCASTARQVSARPCSSCGFPRTVIFGVGRMPLAREPSPRGL